MKPIPGIPDSAVGSIYCIGRNYQKHAHELGNDVPDKPLVFLKPASSVIYDGQSILLPPQSQEIHHEAEMVVVIGQKGYKIPEGQAFGYISGIGLGIDVTARDVQRQAKENGHPWCIAKGFDTFAPVSSFKPFSNGIDLNSLQLSLQINGEIRQNGNTADMIFSVGRIISYLSTIFTLYPGDLIFTGTPDGVSEIQEGDEIQAELNGSNSHLTLSVSVRRETL